MNLVLILIGISMPFGILANLVHDINNNSCNGCCLKNDRGQRVFSWRSDGIVNSSAVLGLHTEIQQFYDYMQLTPIERALRDNATARIESLVLQIWSNAKIKPFGSFAWGFTLPTSDIDLLILEVANKSSLPLLAEKIHANDIAEKNSIQVKDAGRISFIKYIDRESKIDFDMTFENAEEMSRLAELLSRYRREYPVFVKIAIVLKQFLSQHNLNKRITGGIASFALYMICINFLEMHPEIKAKEDVNLGALLLDFLELYGQNFDYENVGIRIGNDGKCLPRNELPCGLVNGQFRLFCIEDAINPWLNAGFETYRALDVKKAFSNAYNTLLMALQNDTNVQNGSILNQIVSVGNDILEYRNWIRDNFDSNGIRSNEN